MILYYIHDPMCSWCWGFKPTLKSVENNLPKEVKIKYILGGLAEDSNTPMRYDLKNQIISTWKRIEETVPGTSFNYEFWEKCIPVRSTYPSCRAVLSAKKQGTNNDLKMLLAIQEAYYMNSQNPSDLDILIELASNIGLDSETFTTDILSKDINDKLINEIEFSRRIGATSFPSLYLEKESNYYPIVLDYNNADIILEHIKSYILS